MGVEVGAALLFLTDFFVFQSKVFLRVLDNCFLLSCGREGCLGERSVLVFQMGAVLPHILIPCCDWSK